ncbi:hypothetical protein [Bdellovibrio reynosensis]|uniref:Outer membrane protein beta-barrel domain-containing protein n=1 Tax=Bdellovibrio reynosensis TaxID=2835041 RepID=A0ABY4CBK3_9BACT|nr:hypothetical protein [Bdellovibrio reynosensis]UOF02223.1 hypothetical protein MNR06_04575 [Bdellovibrio reynosensis]
MKKFFAYITVLLVLMIYHSAQAEVAVGAVLGDPTGLSARTAIDGQHSVDGALAYNSGTYSGLHLHLTYLRDRARTFATTEGPIELYYGLGLRLISVDKGKYDGDTALGPRAPLGLVYHFKNPNVEVFGEIALALDVVPRTDVDLDVGVGVRLRF